LKLNAPKSISAGAGVYTALSQTQAEFQGLLLREREGNVYRSKKGEEDRVG